MKPVKAWDNVSSKFNTYKKDIWYGAADNIYTVWPVFLNYIKKHYKNQKFLRALEFGCGTGMFAGKLKSLGFKSTGIDISPQMIAVAKKHLGKKVKYLVGDSKTAFKIAKKEGKFDLITCIMVLQFVKNVKACLRDLTASLERGGHIIFANHNPKNLAERKTPRLFNVAQTGNIVKIYQESAQDYHKIFKRLGFVKIMEKYLDSPNFIKKYHVEKTKNPKYMILAYKKI
jgi:2-polyprenyl-3-methyl-5-hydroxy-6-metoxy-1,4-benzoquinol methylase